VSWHELHCTLELARPREDVFSFFADAATLQRITPPELHFSVVGPLPVGIEAGTEIEYRLRLFGIPFSWKSRITEWAPPECFVDKQVKGPYASWIHRHTFRDGKEGGTLIADDVRYRLPFHPLGEPAYPLVRFQLGRIFRYRQAAVSGILLGR
jgi:ligand-binding SRPBCC domain-containing protein